MRPFHQRVARGVAAVIMITGLIGSAAAVVIATPEAEATTPSACPAPVVSGATATVTCAYTGADQSWTVPAGVTQVTFAAYGAQGAGGDPFGQGGGGGETSATFSVTPGSALTVVVGGSDGSYQETPIGAFGGGGLSCFPGGGASTISNGASNLIIAGGGGGGSVYNTGTSLDPFNGGYGGGLSGTGGGGGGGGAPGTQSSGYQMGQGGPGADGGCSGANPPNGGGGGGGYWGGNGGKAWSGGGGGSGYVNPSAINSGMQTGVQSGNGEVVITYTVPGAVPTVSGVSPNTGSMSGGTPITVTGTGFAPGATVVIGQGNGAGTGAIAVTNVTDVSSTQITAVTGGGAKAGTFSLFVTTSAGTSAGNSGADFTYTAPVAPTVGYVDPDWGPTTGGTHITVGGTGFVVGARVVIGQGNGVGSGAIAATDVTAVSSTEITAVTGGGAKVGTFHIYVTTSGGTSAAANNTDFSYGNQPIVSALSPKSGPTTGGTTITITGTNFVTGAKVVIGQGDGTTGSIAATVTSITPTTITATTGGGATAGTFGLFVTTSGGTSNASNRAYFTYTS